MPWEISIVNSGDAHRKPLGPLELVTRQLSEALPGTVLCGPPELSDEILATMPAILRKSAERGDLEATFEHPDFSIQFYACNSDPIPFINAEVRGDGDPFPALKKLCDSTGWSVRDAASDSLVDLDNIQESAWRRFCEWRDKAFKQE